MGRPNGTARPVLIGPNFRRGAEPEYRDGRSHHAGGSSKTHWREAARFSRAHIGPGLEPGP